LGGFYIPSPTIQEDDLLMAESQLMTSQGTSITMILQGFLLKFNRGFDEASSL
jgi:hypothetical protein